MWKSEINGYFIDFSTTQKNLNSPPNILAEISKPYIGEIINDKYKSFSLLSILSLINLSILEGQFINGYFMSVKNLVEKMIINKNWIEK